MFNLFCSTILQFVPVVIVVSTNGLLLSQHTRSASLKPYKGSDLMISLEQRGDKAPSNPDAKLVTNPMPHLFINHQPTKSYQSNLNKYKKNINLQSQERKQTHVDLHISL